MTEPEGQRAAPGASTPASAGSSSTLPQAEAARKPAPPERAAARKPGEDDDGLETPYLTEVREIFRQLIITEKNLGLYPAFSRVVKDSTAKLVDTVRKAVDLAGTLRFQIGPDQIEYENEVVYSEADKKKSLAFRIHKDGVREITILPDVAAEEIDALVTCLKQARKVDDEDDDFITLFWEKDSTNIVLQLAEDFVSTEDLPPVPESREGVDAYYVQRFKVRADERERLMEALESAQPGEEDEDAESPFEITEDEARAIRELAQKEESYFPLFDFVHILIEVMVRNPDPEAFSKSVKMLRTILAAVIEDLDFEHAAYLMRQLSEEGHPGLTELHRRQLREMLETFTDKQTLTILETFLKESDRLPPNHPVFTFMKAYPRSATESFCPFLRFSQHVQGVSGVLVHLGAGSASSLAKHLTNPDPLVVRALIGVLLETDDEASVKHIAKALKHPDEGVRIHAAKTILEKGDASLSGLFVPLLQENSTQLLNVALQFFAKVSCPDAYDNLEALVRSRVFHSLDRKRQMLCFKALLRASYSRGIDFLGKKVLKWTRSLSSASRDRKTAALMALASCNAKQAVKLLTRFARKGGKHPLAQTARRSLKELESRQKRQRHRKAPRKKDEEVKSV